MKSNNNGYLNGESRKEEHPLEAFFRALCRMKWGGRASRKEYWTVTLGAVLIAAGLLAVIGFGTCAIEQIVSNEASNKFLQAGGCIMCLYLALAVVVLLSVGCRRLHDVGATGWWQCCLIVPYAGYIAMLFFYCREGQQGINQYGSQP